jgi:hypothetical protein
MGSQDSEECRRRRYRKKYFFTKNIKVGKPVASLAICNTKHPS